MLKNHIGFTLIEVLLSLTILSLILLGLTAMQTVAYQQTDAAYFFNIASNQMQSMSRRLYALNNNQGIDQQFAVWKLQNEELLPQAKSELSGTYPSYTVTLTWGAHPSCETTQIGLSGCLKNSVQVLL